MILVDTSVWVDHLRTGEPQLATLLERGRVLMHPAVIGEIALGSLRQRDLVLRMLAQLPQAITAGDAEVLRWIDAARLWGRGIGFLDAHLLAAARLTPGARLWTRDRRLHEVAVTLELGIPELV
jgi:predicted nucleic acid-binding protein